MPTVPPAADPVVANIVRQIVARSNPLRVILFGSRAQGTARPDSDVDLLVVLPDGTDRRKARVALGSRIQRHVGLDLLVATPETLDQHRNNPGLIYREILQTGVDVYAA